MKVGDLVRYGPSFGILIEDKIKNQNRFWLVAISESNNSQEWFLEYNLKVLNESR